MHRRHALLTLVCAIGLTAGALGQSTPSVDWPQWRGPTAPASRARRACCSSGPPRARRAVWSVAELGAGYGSVAVSGDRIFVQGVARTGRASSRPEPQPTARSLWSKALGAAGDNDRGPGPRGTPTVDGDRVYVLTENGDLACLRVAGRRRGVAAQHPEGLRRPQHRLADQRVAARRRQQRRSSRRAAAAPAWSRSTR